MENFFNTFMAGEYVSPAYTTIPELLEAINAIHKPIYDFRTQELGDIDQAIAGVTAFPILFENQYSNLIEDGNEMALSAEIQKYVDENEIGATACFAFCVTIENIAIQVFDTIEDYREDKETFIDIKAMFFDDVDEEDNSDESSDNA